MTRNEFLNDLRSGNQNFAVELHIKKVEKMTEAEFAIHYANLTAPNPARDAAIASMARSITRRRR